MQMLNPQTNFSISTDRLREILKTNSIAFPPADIQLPSVKELKASVQLKTLEVPWESNLKGFRISNLNGTGLRILQRREGKVVWSCKIDERISEEIYKTFLDSVKLNTDKILGLVAANKDEKYVYDIETCAQLLRDTFLKDELIRLAPRVTWPSDSECIKLTKDVVGPPAWEYSDPSANLSFEKTPDEFKFIARGERGEIEGGKTSKNEDEVYLAIFNWITMKDSYYGKDETFTAIFPYYQ